MSDSTEKSALPGKKRAFIKLYSEVDSGQVASGIIGLADWVDCYQSLAPTFPRMSEHVLGIGGLFYDANTDSYYCSGTFIKAEFRGQGHGISLYKILLLAAREHARLRRRGRVVKFSPHQAVGSSTSESAWRCYRALTKRGYLCPEKKEEKKDLNRDLILVARRYPEYIQPSIIILGK